MACVLINIRHNTQTFLYIDYQQYNHYIFQVIYAFPVLIFNYQWSLGQDRTYCRQCLLQSQTE